jgi:hypothetical protein
MKAAWLPATGSALIGRLDELDNEGKRWIQKWSASWRGDIEQARGNQWGDPKNEPMFLANYISNLLLKKQALLTESKPQLDVLVRSPGLYNTSLVLRDTIKALWDELGFQITLEQSATYLETLGHFFWKTIWDPTALYGLGDIAVQAIDPRLIRVDPSIVHIYDIQQAQYIIEDEIVPLSWVMQHYPKTANQVSPNANLSMLGADSAERGFFRRWVYKRHADVKDSAVPRVWIRRYWVKDPAMGDDDKPLFPGGRLVVRTGDDVILNPNPETEQQNPYFDGQHPYDMMDNRPDIDHPFGRSEVQDLKRLQEAMNRIGHTFVRGMVKNVDWVISDANALTPDTIAALKQLEQVVIEKGAGREVNRVPATQPSQVELAAIQALIGIMKEVSGVSDDPMGGAKGRVEMRSGAQLEGLQSAAQLLVRFQARRLEYFFERVGQKLISRIFQFYTTDRILSYADADKVKTYNFEKDKLRAEIMAQALVAVKERFENDKAKAEANGDPPPKASDAEALGADDILLAIKGAWRKFSMKIIPYTSLYQTRAGRASLKMQMAEMMYLPASEVLAELGFDNPKELMQQAIKEMTERQALGLPPPQAGGQKKKGGQK